MEIQAELKNTVIMITHDVDEAVLLSDRIVMMTNGPAASIGEILEIGLQRPRDRLALADDPAYNHYRAEVLRFLYERHAHGDSETGSGTEQATEQAAEQATGSTDGDAEDDDPASIVPMAEWRGKEVA